MGSRDVFYVISLVIGIAFMSLYLVCYAIFGADSWFIYAHVVYLILSLGLVIAFFIKDGLDERAMRQGGSPVGPSWFEHAPFALMHIIFLIILANLETDSTISIIIYVFALLAFIDLFWDVSQDIRSGRYR